jgi:Cysteine dioxygenase type I
MSDIPMLASAILYKSTRQTRHEEGAANARERRVRAGTSFSFDPDHIHRLNGAVQGSISVHVYSPPLWRMGQYRVDDDGTLKRVSLSYADELRPI